ncbi:MAG: lipopolysaccharide biosynthesis protein [bacterium]
MTPSRHETDLDKRGGSGETSGDEVLTGLIGQLGSDALRYIPAVIVPAGLSILHFSIFTRVFDPGPYGQYSLVYAVAAIATSVLAGWLQQGVLRYLPRYRQEGRVPEFHAKVRVFVWLVALLVLVVALAAHWFVRPLLGEYARYYFPALVWVIAWLFFFVQNHALRADLQSARFARYQILYAVGRLLFSLGFVYLVSRDVMGLIVGATVAYLVLLWPMQVELGLMRRSGGRRFRIDLPLLREFVRYGFPLIGWVLGVKVLDLSDRFIIELFRDSEEVGIYSANFNLVSMGILFVATPLLSAALPLIVNAWEEGHRSRRRFRWSRSP